MDKIKIITISNYNKFIKKLFDSEEEKENKIDIYNDFYMVKYLKIIQNPYQKNFFNLLILFFIPLYIKLFIPSSFLS